MDNKIVNCDIFVQEVFSFLLGLVMVISGCLYMCFFKFMVWYYQFFFMSEEILYWVCIIYLFFYVMYKQNFDGVLCFDDLKLIYKYIYIINVYVVAWIKNYFEIDFVINVIVFLDLIIKDLLIVVDEDFLELK